MVQITAEPTDEPGFFYGSGDDVYTPDGQLANASGAINASHQDLMEGDEFYRHSAVVTAMYCLACKLNIK